MPMPAVTLDNATAPFANPSMPKTVSGVYPNTLKLNLTMRSGSQRPESTTM